MKDIRENREYREVLAEIVISSQLVVAGGEMADEFRAPAAPLAEKPAFDGIYAAFKSSQN